MTALLEVDEISFSYGRLQVLFDVSLDVADHSRVALLGTNGAGKSTLLQVISGLGRPSHGVVRFDGHDITRLAPHERVALGIVQVAGGNATFAELTVMENLRMGAYAFGRGEARVSACVDDALDRFPALAPRLRQQAGQLSGGEQQMLAIARALIAQPRLLLIDELSLGLAPAVVAELVHALDGLSAQGITLVVVEQSLNVAMAIADSAYFMEKGQIRYSGPIADLYERGDLARSVFLGAAT